MFEHRAGRASHRSHCERNSDACTAYRSAPCLDGGGVMGWLSGRGERSAEVAAPCRFCRNDTTERDRTGKPAHKACVARVVVTATEESRPSRDPHDLAQRVRETGTDGPVAGPSAAARFEAVVYATAAAMVGERWRVR